MAASLRKAFNKVKRPVKALALCVALGAGLANIFSERASDGPGEPYKDGQPIPEVVNMNHSGFRTVSIPYILRTGHIVNYRKAPSLNTIINFDHDDPFTRALSTIEKNSCERVKRNPALKELLAKDNWTREDRLKWERIVSAIVSEEVDKIPGFDHYRTPSQDNDVKHAWILNQLSEDIAADSSKLEFDCESMSIVEGIILQKIDDKFVYGTGDENYKKATTYYLGSGFVGLGSHDEELGGHSFLISSVTGSIIEGTSDPDYGSTPYREVLNPGYSLRDFLKDQPAVTWDPGDNNIDVYMPRQSLEDYKAVQTRVKSQIDSMRLRVN